MNLRNTLLRTAIVCATAFSLTACNSTATKETAAPVAQAMGNEDIYEVFHDGRINVFYDRETYTSFLELGEVTFRLTQIGSGPNGETVVFGLTKADKKKGLKTPAAMMWNGELKPADDFYAELRNHGRIYVFSTLEDMKPVHMFGHPNFFYTEIGSGPKGETVVYVLNKSNKKKKPLDLIARFKSENS